MCKSSMPLSDPQRYPGNNNAGVGEGVNGEGVVLHGAAVLAIAGGKVKPERFLSKANVTIYPVASRGFVAQNRA